MRLDRFVLAGALVTMAVPALAQNCPIAQSALGNFGSYALGTTIDTLPAELQAEAQCGEEHCAFHDALGNVYLVHGDVIIRKDAAAAAGGGEAPAGWLPFELTVNDRTSDVVRKLNASERVNLLVGISQMPGEGLVVTTGLCAQTPFGQQFSLAIVFDDQERIKYVSARLAPGY